MKKFYVYALTLIGIFVSLNISSCSKDKKEEVSGSILGIWKCYYNELDGKIFTGDDIDFPYMIIEDQYLGFSKTPSMPSADVYGEKYLYTYNSDTKVMTLLAIDETNNEPWDDDDFFDLQIVKLTSTDFDFEWDVNGGYEIFKYKKYK